MASEEPSEDEASRKDAAKMSRELPSEQPTTLWTRRWILLSFWLVIACLGLPHWLWTTSIHRSSLPLESMNQWAEGKVPTRMPYSEPS